MNNCAHIASLIKDTIRLCHMTFKNNEESEKARSEIHKDRNEMTIFLEEVNGRMKLYDRGTSSSFYPKETHTQFVEGLDQLDRATLARDFGGFKQALSYGKFQQHLRTKLTMLTWLFGNGVMAPKNLKAGEFSKQLLREWRCLIPPMMMSCAKFKKDIKGVTNFREKQSTVWPKLNDCLATHRKKSIEFDVETNGLCVLVLGVMDKNDEVDDTEDSEDIDEDCDMTEEDNEDENEESQECKMAVKMKGKAKFFVGINKHKANESFDETMFKGHLTAMNAKRLHCFMHACNWNWEGDERTNVTTDVITVTPIKSETQLREDKKTPKTIISWTIGHKNYKSEFCHMIRNIELRFKVIKHFVKLHKHILI